MTGIPVANRNQTGTYDCLIIGGGPAGLMAATYLGRFRRRVIVIDAGESRAKWIPITHNCPGFPDGISGTDLLERLRQQALRYSAELVDDTVRDIRRDGIDFIATVSFPIRARSVLMATGIVDTLPEISDIAEMIKAGTLRLCPVCDGYEVIGQRVGVIGALEDAMKKALYMRTFTPHVTLLLTESATKGEALTIDMLMKAGIAVRACMPNSICADNKQVIVGLTDGTMLTFDTIYPALGCAMRSNLVIDLGAQRDEVGNLIVDSHQRTAIPGLYAAGDVVDEINQIAVAFGQAAVAASDMHNYLRESDEEQ